MSIGWRAARDADSPVDALKLERGGVTWSCDISLSALCASGLTVEQRGPLALVCMPRGHPHDGHPHDGCLTTAFTVDGNGPCVLVDEARGTCQTLSFANTHLRSPSLLEAELWLSGPLPAAPTRLADLIAMDRARCPAAFGFELCKHGPPFALLRVQLNYEGAVELRKVLGRLDCSEQACDVAGKASPVTFGCPPPKP